MQNADNVKYLQKCSNIFHMSIYISVIYLLVLSWSNIKRDLAEKKEKKNTFVWRGSLIFNKSTQIVYTSVKAHNNKKMGKSGSLIFLFVSRRVQITLKI